jgi:hypothetical protein
MDTTRRTKAQAESTDSAIQAGRVGEMACQAIAFGWDASAYALAREAARLGLAAINARSN